MFSVMMGDVFFSVAKRAFVGVCADGSGQKRSRASLMTVPFCVVPDDQGEADFFCDHGSRPGILPISDSRLAAFFLRAFCPTSNMIALVSVQGHVTVCPRSHHHQQYPHASTYPEELFYCILERAT